MLESLTACTNTRRTRKMDTKSPLKLLITKKAQRETSTVDTNGSLGKRELPSSPSEERNPKKMQQSSMLLEDISVRENVMASAIYSYKSFASGSLSRNNTISLKLPAPHVHFGHTNFTKVSSSFNNDIIPLLPFGKSMKKLKV
jgi:hypothetical protein